MTLLNDFCILIRLKDRLLKFDKEKNRYTKENKIYTKINNHNHNAKIIKILQMDKKQITAYKQNNEILT